MSDRPDESKTTKPTKEREMIEAFELNGVLTLSFEGRTVDISLDGLGLFQVVDYIERKTGKRVNLSSYATKRNN